jgi:DNA-binding IclR family transcriptional regulator
MSISELIFRLSTHILSVLEQVIPILYNGKMRKRNNRSTELDETDKTELDGSLVSSVVRAANILVSLSNGVNNVTDLSKYCNLSKSTVHRLLKTLEEPRFVVYDSINHRYYLGPLVTQLASNAKATHQYLIMSALEEMKRLADIAEETVTLTLLVGIQFIHLYEITCKQGLKVDERVGDKEEGIAPLLPLGAIQKVLLSQLNDDELKLALKSIESGNSTGNGIQIDQLMIEIHQIRQQGYAVTHGERISGALSISAPVKNYFCPVALSILGPENRLILKEPQVLEDTRAGADRLSENIIKLFK